MKFALDTNIMIDGFRSEEAQAEVAALATRREEIAGELGRLSGVIEALAVPAAGRTPAPATTQRDDSERRLADVPRWSLDLSE